MLAVLGKCCGTSVSSLLDDVTTLLLEEFRGTAIPARAQRAYGKAGALLPCRYCSFYAEESGIRERLNQVRINDR
ncbi:MAG: hypothetical protein PHD37_11900 [Gallionellaceae bacterium]|nr:hypothetical protein [Gallionellaceae bacterium]